MSIEASIKLTRWYICARVYLQTTMNEHVCGIACSFIPRVFWKKWFFYGRDFREVLMDVSDLHHYIDSQPTSIVQTNVETS